jgi:3-(3-hydroxy-phenyl)propionate hydroxylase
MGPYDGPPVVVIGNGPVGQTVALLLARWEIPTVVVEASTYRAPAGSRSLCQQRDVLDIWDHVGAGRQIADEGVTWRTARTFYREHELFSVAFTDPGRSPFPPWVNLPQARVEQVLDERMAEAPLIDVRWGHRVVGLRHDDLGVEVDVVSSDGPQTLRAAYVVACAGAHGDLVRDALGLRFEGSSFEDRFLVCDIRCGLPDLELERRFHFDPEWNPGRQVLVHPQPDSTYRIDWQVPTDFDLASEEWDGRLDRRIRQVIGDRPYELLFRSVYRFHSRCTDRMRVGRVLLAGDCAHLVAPFGARGLNSGVADAENAAWRIAWALRGWASHQVVAAYDEERRAAALDNLAVTTRTMDFLVPQTEDGRARRSEVLERAVTDPDARALIDSGRLYAPYRYGDDPRPAVGAILPDHPVGDTRLRVLARHGLLLLSTGEICPPAVRAPVTSLTVEPDLAAELGMADDEVWVVRPDAHVADVVDPAHVTSAVRMVLRRPG